VRSEHILAIKIWPLVMADPCSEIKAQAKGRAQALAPEPCKAIAVSGSAGQNLK